GRDLPQTRLLNSPRGCGCRAVADHAALRLFDPHASANARGSAQAPTRREELVRAPSDHSNDAAQADLFGPGADRRRVAGGAWPRAALAEPVLEMTHAVACACRSS